MESVDKNGASAALTEGFEEIGGVQIYYQLGVGAVRAVRSVRTGPCSKRVGPDRTVIWRTAPTPTINVSATVITMSCAHREHWVAYFAIVSSHFVGTTTDFHKQMLGFDATKFTLVAWDPPGYGRSRPPDPKQEPATAQKDAKIAAELMRVGICSLSKAT